MSRSTSRQTSSTKRPDVLLEARGRWPGLLAAIGVEESSLSGRHGPCPIPGCGGKDRFRFDDKEGRGTYYCTQCGAGDGIKLVMQIKGLEFKEAIRLVSELMPLAPEVKRAKERTAKEKGAALARMWDAAKPVVAGGMVDAYLHSRGIVARSDMLREGALPYYDENMRRVAEFPAMVARIVTVDGKGASLHVTYLSPEGGKAAVPAPKKVMAPVRPIMGAAVQLYPLNDDGVLGVGEGIETAFAASELFTLPVWATLNTECMAAFVWPPATKRLVIFGDHDRNFAGHKAAYTLAYRAAGRGLAVEVQMAPYVDSDWNDVLRERAAKKAA